MSTRLEQLHKYTCFSLLDINELMDEEKKSSGSINIVDREAEYNN